ncbi:hypothetical protein LUZ60_004952 [Juncus effusus]|nr:hypothetical protein LUZ60_004952 [Juncus effusus]
MKMEQFMRQCDKELMKMAMLKHEETFRQQVHELHRLYRIQKQLMRDMKSTNNNSKELKRQRSSVSPPNHHSKPRRALNLQLSADEFITNQENQELLELTLAVGRRKKRENTPTASLSSNSTESESGHLDHAWVQSDQTGQLNQDWIPIQLAEHVRVRSFELGQDGMKNPPWFVQCLSLRMT